MVDTESIKTGGPGGVASGFVAGVRFEHLDSCKGGHVELGQPGFTHLQFTQHPLLLH